MSQRQTNRRSKRKERERQRQRQRQREEEILDKIKLSPYLHVHKLYQLMIIYMVVHNPCFQPGIVSVARIIGISTVDL